MKQNGIILLMMVLSLLSKRVLAENDGYFLSWKQKGQLISSGRIRGNDGRIYDILICPGYRYPVRYGWNNIKEAGSDLSEYFQRQKYSRMFNNSMDCLEWGFEDCLLEFTFEGAAKSWNRNFSQAHERTKKRVFGWWMAYPWATFKSVVDNAVRIPLGAIGCGLGTVSGVGLVPAYHLSDSAFKAAWDGSVQGVALPVSGLAWNTIISPPLAIAGQKPSEKRVDGFWVRIVPESYIPGKTPSGNDIANLAKLGILLKDELEPFESERQEIENKRKQQLKELYEEISKVNKEKREELKKIKNRELAFAENLLVSGKYNQLAEEIRSYGWSISEIRANQARIKKVLQKNKISSDEIRLILRLLSYNAKAITEIPEELSNQHQKLDPVTETIHTIKEID